MRKCVLEEIRHHKARRRGVAEASLPVFQEHTWPLPNNRHHQCALASGPHFESIAVSIWIAQQPWTVSEGWTTVPTHTQEPFGLKRLTSERHAIRKWQRLDQNPGPRHLHTDLLHSSATLTMHKGSPYFFKKIHK